MESKIYRILVAKPGLDGHDRGAKVVAKALRNAGFEVIYTGLRQTPEMIVNAAIQEDVDMIGISTLSGAHGPLVDKILKLMKEENFSKPLFVGGVISPKDSKLLKSQGVSEVFGPGSSLESIVQSIKKVLSSKS